MKHYIKQLILTIKLCATSVAGYSIGSLMSLSFLETVYSSGKLNIWTWIADIYGYPELLITTILIVSAVLCCMAWSARRRKTSDRKAGAVVFLVSLVCGSIFWGYAFLASWGA